MDENQKQALEAKAVDLLKQYIDEGDDPAIKSFDFRNNTIYLYKTDDKSGDPVGEINLPEEMFLDQAKTTFAEEFEWSLEKYPGSENPNLDGQPVLILAVKGDTTVNYSFVSIGAMIKPYSGGNTQTVNMTITDNTVKGDVKISQKNNNALTVNDDGLHVEKVVFATPEEVLARLKRP